MQPSACTPPKGLPTFTAVDTISTIKLKMDWAKRKCQSKRHYIAAKMGMWGAQKRTARERLTEPLLANSNELPQSSNDSILECSPERQLRVKPVDSTISFSIKWLEISSRREFSKSPSNLGETLRSSATENQLENRICRVKRWLQLSSDATPTFSSQVSDLDGESLSGYVALVPRTTQRVSLPSLQLPVC